MADVAYAIATELGRESRPRSAETLREAAFLWTLRARALRGTNVHLLAEGEDIKSPNHLRLRVGGVNLSIVPAPYRAFAAYKVRVAESKLIHVGIKKHVKEFQGTKLSKMFSGMKGPMMPANTSICTRYLTDPARLGRDMERSWKELRDDVREAVMVYALEQQAPKRKAEVLDAVVEQPVAISFSLPAAQGTGSGKRYIDLYINLPPDTMDWYDDTLAALDPLVAERLSSATYKDAAEMQRVFMAAIDGPQVGGSGVTETVN